MLLSLDQTCRCERSLALCCWILSGKLLTGHKRRHVSGLLREAIGATRFIPVSGMVGCG